MTRISALALLALVACNGDSEPPDNTGAEKTADLVFMDANNYNFSSTLEIGEVTVAPQSDVSVDWSGLTTDIRGRDQDPSALQQILFVEFNLQKDEVVTKVDANNLLQSDSLSQWLFYNNGSTSALTSDFSIIGNPFNVDELDVDPNTTWLMSFVNIVDERFDIQMSVFVTPTEGESNTSVVVNDSSSTLDFTADLHTADPLVTGAEMGPYSLDWSGVSTDVFGRSFDPSMGNRLTIGHLDQTDVADVEGIFLRLFEEATDLWFLDTNGVTSADLSAATHQVDGTPFDGFTAGGTWIVAVECTRQECTNPAPLLLGVVQVD